MNFMIKKEVFDYRELVIKFLAGEISDGEIDNLKEWLERDPVNRRIFDKENELWQESGTKTKHDYFKLDKTWSDLSSNLNIGGKRAGPVLILKKNNFRIFIAAASIVCMVAIGTLALWLVNSRSIKQIVNTSTKVCTNQGEKAHIYLPDSTMIYMNSGTSIEYSSYYNVKERKVKLKGEAYFDIRSNPERPFIIELDKMILSATGTRVNVFSYENEGRIETTLVEGNIQVTINDQEPLDIKPGQQVVYFTKTNKALIRNVNAETYTSWKENKLRFIDTPFEEVLRNIARRYNVTFEIRSHDLLDLKFTATFIDESIDDVMQLLQAVSPITYRIQYRTKINDIQYLKPKIIIDRKKTSF